jgi:hypothetical protein
MRASTIACALRVKPGPNIGAKLLLLSRNVRILIAIVMSFPLILDAAGVDYIPGERNTESWR